MHDESYLEGRVCGASAHTSSAGPIQATHCALQVGFSQGLHKFRGYIDDVSYSNFFKIKFADCSTHKKL